MEGKGEAGGVCVPACVFSRALLVPRCMGGAARGWLRCWRGARRGGWRLTDFQTVGRYVQPLTCFKIFHFLLSSPYPTVCYSPGKQQQDIGSGHRESTLERSAEGNKMRSRVRDNAFI